MTGKIREYAKELKEELKKPKPQPASRSSSSGDIAAITWDATNELRKYEGDPEAQLYIHEVSELRGGNDAMHYDWRAVDGFIERAGKAAETYVLLRERYGFLPDTKCVKAKEDAAEMMKLYEADVEDGSELYRDCLLRFLEENAGRAAEEGGMELLCAAFKRAEEAVLVLRGAPLLYDDNGEVYITPVRFSEEKEIDTEKLISVRPRTVKIGVNAVSKLDDLLRKHQDAILSDYKKTGKRTPEMELYAALNRALYAELDKASSTDIRFFHQDEYSITPENVKKNVSKIKRKIVENLRKRKIDRANTAYRALQWSQLTVETEGVGDKDIRKRFYDICTAYLSGLVQSRESMGTKSEFRKKALEAIGLRFDELNESAVPVKKADFLKVAKAYCRDEVRGKNFPVGRFTLPLGDVLADKLEGALKEKDVVKIQKYITLWELMNDPDKCEKQVAHRRKEEARQNGEKWMERVKDTMAILKSMYESNPKVMGAYYGTNAVLKKLKGSESNGI